jgi:putative lipoic acid-binding regulatory protein
MNSNGNGIGNTGTNFDGKEIDFPVTYQLKAVMLGTENDDDSKEKLVNVFNELEIAHKYADKKLSSKGAYVSFTYTITVTNRQQMDALYAELKKIKELKFAV